MSPRHDEYMSKMVERVFRERNLRAKPRYLATHWPPYLKPHSQKPTPSLALEHRRRPGNAALEVGKLKPRGSSDPVMSKWVEKLYAKSKSLYVSNFPEDWKTLDLKESLEKVAPIVDVFIPSKRNKEGKRFAFVRFDQNVNMSDLIVTVKGLWIGDNKILANVARFDRILEGPKKTESRIGFVLKNSRQREDGVSYKQVVQDKVNVNSGSKDEDEDEQLTGKRKI